MVTGSCLCGEIQYTIIGPLNKIQLCHCQQCRKAQGSAFASNISVVETDFKITQGKSLLSVFKSTTREGKRRYFCSGCGSPIISKLDSVPDVVRVRAGTLDEPVNSTIDFHQYVAHKANWWDIKDDLPQHKEKP